MTSATRLPLLPRAHGITRMLRAGMMALALMSCWLTLLTMRPHTHDMAPSSRHLRKWIPELEDQMINSPESTSAIRALELNAQLDQLPQTEEPATTDGAALLPVEIHYIDDKARRQLDIPGPQPTPPLATTTVDPSSIPLIAPRHNTTRDSEATTETKANDSSASIIPHLIHQSWKSANQIPSRFEPWMQSWLHWNPGWKYVFWSDVDNLNLFRLVHPKYFDVATKVGKIQLADMARYALLYELGGLYVDADFECLQTFDQLHATHQLFLSSEPKAHTVLLEGETNSLALCNALMASVPHHPFWLRVLDNILAAFTRTGNSDPVSLTGPRMVKTTYLQFFAHDTSVSVLPQEYFYPEIAYWNIGSMTKACAQRQDQAARAACDWLQQHPHGEFTRNTHASHHWQCTWCLGENSATFRSLDQIFSHQMPQLFKPVISATGNIDLVPWIN